MMSEAAPAVRKFNPGTLQSDEEVIKQFVVRHREFSIVMDVLRDNVGPSVCQHMILVAPRGRGKTMMLARVAAELRVDDALRQNFLPVRFTEESYEVFDLGDFWLEALFHMLPEVAPHNPAMADELREAHAEFSRRFRGRDLEENARTVVLDAAKTLGRKLVLMVENCQSLFDDVDERFGWGLRKTLQAESNVMFLGTAATRLAALDDVRAPFYEFFRQLLLKPLPLDECRALWEATSGSARSEREIRPLQILTGGDPRLLVIIAGFPQHRSLKALLQELVSLIDDHTEYFRSHLEGLSKTQRRTYLALIDLWRPSTTAEIAGRARQDVRTASSLLTRLVKRGAVAYEGSGKNRLYHATQRLYSIYYKLRRQRDEVAVVESLIHWMVACFAGDELSAMAGTLSEEVTQSKAIREGFLAALRAAPTIGDVLPVAVRQVRHQRLLELAERAFDYAYSDDPARAVGCCEDMLRLVSDGEFSAVAACALYIKGYVHGRLGNRADEIDAYDAVLVLCKDRREPVFGSIGCLAAMQKVEALQSTGRLEDAIATAAELNERYGDETLPEIKVGVATALASKGVCYARLLRTEDAIETWDGVVTRFRTEVDASIRKVVAAALFRKAEAQVQMRRPDDALASIEELERGLHAPAEDGPLLWLDWTKAKAQLLLGQRELALKTLQSAYDELIFDDAAPRGLLHHLPELIACGLPEGDLLAVLLSDPEKSARMSPIIATLRQRIGQTVRVPAEVRELLEEMAKKFEKAIERSLAR